MEWSEYSMLRVMTASHAAKKVISYLSLINLFCATVIAFFSEVNGVTALALLFCFCSIAVNFIKGYQTSPFSLLLSFFVTLFLVIPLVFVSVSGSKYQYGNGLRSIPESGSVYSEAAPFAIAFLISCLFAIVVGLIIGNRRGGVTEIAILSRSNTKFLWGIALVVLYLTYASNEAFLKIYSTQEVLSESLLEFIFFDHSYLALAPLVFFANLTTSQPNSSSTKKFQFLVLLFAFLVISTLGTSKGFVIVLIWLSLLIPISYFMKDNKNLVYFPSKLTMALVVPMSIGLFFYAYYARMYKQSGDMEFHIMEYASAVGSDEFLELLSSIFYRLGASFDRYVLIFTTFVGDEFSYDYAIQYLTYLTKNFLNLTLPGTPYQEAYVPSGNLIDAVLTKSPLNGDLTKAELVRSLNTQPHTLPGIFIILTGFLAPLALFLTTFLIAFMYSLFSQVYMRIGLLYLFFVLLQSYGMEVAIANSIHFALSLFLMLYLTSFLSRIKVLGSSLNAN